MSIYEYGDTTVLEATVSGHLENGPPITVPFPSWWPLRDEVYAAARAVVPYPAVADFHLIYRHPSDGQLSRTRWVVDAEMFGPTLLWHEDTSGDSSMMFRLVKRNDIQQLRDDQARPMPWPGLRDIMAAALGKQALGAGPVQIPLEGRDTMVFTPQEIRYSRFGADDVQDPYGNPIHGWVFSAEPTDPYEPALWVVPTGQQDGVKVSVCVNNNDEQWGDLTEPAPPFDLLPAPPGV